MDFAWAGNIKKKLEAVCHELDKSVAQDKAKYVENQLQNAGQGLKKFCSNIQNLLATSEIHSVGQHIILDLNTIIKVESDVAPGDLDNISADQKSDANLQENVFGELHPECEPLSLTSTFCPMISDSPAEQNINAVSNEKLDVNIGESAAKELPHISVDNMIETSASSTNLVIDISKDVKDRMATQAALDPVAANYVKDYSSFELSVLDQHVTTASKDLLEVVEPEDAPRQLYKTLAEKDYSTCKVRAVDQLITTDAGNNLEDAEPEVAPGQSGESLADKATTVGEIIVNEPQLEPELINLSSRNWPRISESDSSLRENLPASLNEKLDVSINENFISESDSSLGGNLPALLNEKLDVSINESLISESGSSLGGKPPASLNEKLDVSINGSFTKKLSYLSKQLSLKHPGNTSVEASATCDLINDDCKYTSKSLEEFVPPLSVHGVDSPPFKGNGRKEIVHISDVSINLSHTQMPHCITYCEDKAAEVASKLTRCPPVKNSDLSELLPENSCLDSTQTRIHLEEPKCASDKLGKGRLSFPDSAVSSGNMLDMVPNYCSSIPSSTSSDANATKVSNTGVQIEISRLQQYQSNEPAQIETSISPKYTGCSNKNFEDLDSSCIKTMNLHNVKLDKSCVYVRATDSELYAVERHIRNRRSYKEKILDVFTSKRRIVKEYKQLAIWFGDADIWPERDTSCSVTLTSESEWELI